MRLLASGVVGFSNAAASIGRLDSTPNNVATCMPTLRPQRLLLSELKGVLPMTNLSEHITRAELDDIDASVIDEMNADMQTRYMIKAHKYGVEWVDVDYADLCASLRDAARKHKWVDVANYAAMLHKRDKLRRVYPNA